SGEVRIGGNLPTGEIDGSQASFDLLNSLAAGHCPQRIGEFSFWMLTGELIPELFGTALSQCMFFLHTSAKPYNFLGSEITGDVAPAWIGVPILLDLIRCCLNDGFHVSPTV